MEEHQKKIQLLELFLILCLTLASDAFDTAGALLLAVPIVGQVIFIAAKYGSFVVWLIVQGWLFMRGLRGLHQIVFFVASMFDIVIPFSQTVGVLIATYLANHPRLIEKAGVLAGGVSMIGRGTAAFSAAKGFAGRAAAAGTVARGGLRTVSALRAVRREEAREGPEAAGYEGRAGMPSGEAGAPTEEGVSEEAFGLEPEVPEKLQREYFREFPTRTSPGGTVAVDNRRNEIDLR